MNETKDLTKLGNKIRKRNLGLYIHIPFCVKKCNYCDFLSGPYPENIKQRYFEALREEIRSYEGRVDDYRVSTVFIGGGTPSSVDYAYIKGILEDIKNVFGVHLAESNSNYIRSRSTHKEQEQAPEVSIEINPGTIDLEKLQAYKDMGINRLSFGLQSADQNELQLLGRIHDYGQFVQNYNLARKVGFTNINIDLISALPGQTIESWETTLIKTAELNPEHISAYSLIIEEGTPFYEQYGEGKKLEDHLPDEDTDRMIYKRTGEILKEYGYHRYEISNYAKEGYECRHNLSYWVGTEYLGLGLGSASLINHTRFHNLRDINHYIKLCTDYCIKKENASMKQNFAGSNNLLEDIIHIRIENEPLNKKQQMEEFMFLGLRIIQGINKSDFFLRFGVVIEVIYGTVINKLINGGLMSAEGDNLFLTDYGIDVSNIVLAEFLLD